MNPLVVDPTHIDVLLSVAINGPSDQPDALHWYTPSAGEITGDPDPLNRRHADEVGAALLAMCIASVRHFYALAELPLPPGPDPTPDPCHYEWSDLGTSFTMFEGLVAISFYEYHSNRDPHWYASPQYAFCNRLRSRLVASLPGCSNARLHWTSEAVIERSLKGSSLEKVLGIDGELPEDAAGRPPTPS